MHRFLIFIFAFISPIAVGSVNYNPNYQDDYLATDESFGASEITATVSDSVRSLGTSLKTQGKITVNADSMKLVGSQIEADTADITADVLQMISGKNSEKYSHFSDSSGLMTRVIEDQGSVSETAAASTIKAGNLIFNGKNINDKAVKDGLISALSSEHDLNIEQVEFIKAELENKEWHTKTTTLSATGQIIVQALTTAIAPGVGNAALSGVTNAAVKAAVQAALNSLSKQVVSSLITAAITGEKPDFDLDAMVENAVKAGLTAGAGNYADGLIANANLNEAGGWVADTVSDAAIQTAVHGGSFEDNIIDTAIDKVGADVAGFIGDETDAGSIANIASHAALGCALGEAKAGDCGSGAAGGALSAALAPQIAKGVDDGDGVLSAQEKKQVKALAQIGTALITTAAGRDVNVANETALNEVTNNYLSHSEAHLRDTLKARLETCRTSGECSAEEIGKLQASVDKINEIDDMRDQQLLSACQDSGSAECTGHVNQYIATMKTWDSEIAKLSAEEKKKLFNEFNKNPSDNTGFKEYLESKWKLNRSYEDNRIRTQYPKTTKAMDALGELDLQTAVAEILGLPPGVVDIVSMTNPKNWAKGAGKMMDNVGKKNTNKINKPLHDKINDRGKQAKFEKETGFKNEKSITGKKANAQGREEYGKGYQKEWNDDDIVKTGKLPGNQKPGKISRVHPDKKNPAGAYHTSSDELIDKNRGQTKDQLALPEKSNASYKSDYRGTKDREAMIGRAGKNDWGKGGGTQIKFKDRVKGRDYHEDSTHIIFNE